VIMELLLIPGIVAADYFSPAAPDFEVEATYFSYAVSGLNVLISVIVNGAFVFGGDITDL